MSDCYSDDLLRRIASHLVYPDSPPAPPEPPAATLTRETLDEAIRQVMEAPYRPTNYPTFPDGFLSAINPFSQPKQTIFTERERNRLALIVAQLPEPLHPADYRFLREAMDRWVNREASKET